MAEDKTAASDLMMEDPYRSYNFKLLIGNVTEAHFMECSGMGVKINVIKYRVSGRSDAPGDPGYYKKIPGPVEYGDIVLKYGLTRSDSLWNWFMSGVNGAVQPKNITLQLLDNAGRKPVMQWDLIGAWASEWKGAQLNTMGREVAIESVTLVYENLVRTAADGKVGA